MIEVLDYHVDAHHWHAAHFSMRSKRMNHAVATVPEAWLCKGSHRVFRKKFDFFNPTQPNRVVAGCKSSEKSYWLAIF